MANIFFISDTHWSHSNILTFTDKYGKKMRPEFDTVSQMDEYMMDMWNQKIRPQDKVYHLGDVFFGDFEHYKTKIHNKLNGHKRLLLGNHDNDPKLFGLFQKVQLIRQFPEYDFVCSHIPMNKFSCFNHRKNLTMINVHGHVHVEDVPDSGYVNISCERTNYTPISLEDVITLVEKEKLNGLSDRGDDS